MKRWVVGFVVTAVVIAGAAPAQAATCRTFNATNEPSSTFTGGEKIVVRGTGFGPGSLVLVSLQQGTRTVELGRAAANDLGAFAFDDAAVPGSVTDGKANIRAIDARGSATCALSLRAGKGAGEGSNLNGLFLVWGLLLAAGVVVLAALTYRRWKTERLREAFDQLAWREAFDERFDATAGAEVSAPAAASENLDVREDRTPGPTDDSTPSPFSRLPRELDELPFGRLAREPASAPGAEPLAIDATSGGRTYFLDDDEDEDDGDLDPERESSKAWNAEGAFRASGFRQWLEFEDGDPDPLVSFEPTAQASRGSTQPADPQPLIGPPPMVLPEPVPAPEAAAQPVWTYTHTDPHPDWEPDDLPIPLERGPVDDDFEPSYFALAEREESKRAERQGVVESEPVPEPVRVEHPVAALLVEDEPVTEPVLDRAPPYRSPPPAPVSERRETVSEPPRLPIGWDTGRLRPQRRTSDAIARLRREVRTWKR